MQQSFKLEIIVNTKNKFGKQILVKKINIKTKENINTIKIKKKYNKNLIAIKEIVIYTKKENTRNNYL